VENYLVCTKEGDHRDAQGEQLKCRGEKGEDMTEKDTNRHRYGFRNLLSKSKKRKEKGRGKKGGGGEKGG